MKTIKLLFAISLVFVTTIACKKKTVEPVVPDAATTGTQVTVKQYNFQFLFQGGHNTGSDTLVIKYNGITKTVNKTFFRVQTGDKISIYYNPGFWMAAVDSNKVKLALDNNTLKEYNCTCITNEEIIIP